MREEKYCIKSNSEVRKNDDIFDRAWYSEISVSVDFTRIDSEVALVVTIVCRIRCVKWILKNARFKCVTDGN